MDTAVVKWKPKCGQSLFFLETNKGPVYAVVNKDRKHSKVEESAIYSDPDSNRICDDIDHGESTNLRNQALLRDISKGRGMHDNSVYCAGNKDDNGTHKDDDALETVSFEDNELYTYS